MCSAHNELWVCGRVGKDSQRNGKGAVAAELRDCVTPMPGRPFNAGIGSGRSQHGRR